MVKTTHAVTSHGMWELSKAAVHQRVGEIARRGIVPIILGGDHSITWPAATAVAEYHGFGNVGMIHFDAHADTAEILQGNLASHGTPMRRLIESGAIPGHNFIQVGLRGYWPGEEDQNWMRGQDLLRVVRQIVLDTNVVAMDVTEVSPPYDHGVITVNNARGLTWQALAAMTHKKRQAAKL